MFLRFKLQSTTVTKKSTLIHSSSVTFFFWKNSVCNLAHVHFFLMNAFKEKYTNGVRLALTYLSIGFQVQLDDAGSSYASLVLLVMEKYDQNILAAHISVGIWSP